MTLPLWLVFIPVVALVIFAVWSVVDWLYDHVVVPRIIARLAQKHDVPLEQVEAMWGEFDERG